MRHYCRLTFLCFPLAITAQTPIHYKLTESSPSTISAIDGSAISTIEKATFVTIGARDSANMTIWELVVDSASAVVIPRDTLEARRTRIQVGPVVLRPSGVIYRVRLRSGKIVKKETDGRAATFAFDLKHPQWSLLAQLPGLAVVAQGGLPASVGDVRVDTTTRHAQTAAPADTSRGHGAVTDDTVIVKWTRTSAGRIDGEATHHARTRMASIYTVAGVGAVEILFDDQGLVVEVTARMEDTRTSVPKVITGGSQGTTLTTAKLERVG